MKQDCNIHKVNKGAASEYAAILWLWGQGYNVYRNASPFGPCDLIAEKDNELLKIDVKTVGAYLANSKYSCPAATEYQTKNNIKILMVYLDGVTGTVIGWRDNYYESVFPKKEISCLYCGVVSPIKNGRQKHKKYCSDSCRETHALIKAREKYHLKSKDRKKKKRRRNHAMG